VFLVVDARRGLGKPDLALIDWADPVARAVHVLLTKCDKLNRSEASKALRRARAELASRASAQLFSGPGGEGVREAQEVLESWLDA
jgi:GTP-binding protein